MHDGTLLGAVLAAEGISFILVGSAALRLHGVCLKVHDTDVVIEPTGENLRKLDVTLRHLSLGVPTQSYLAALCAREVLTISTTYGKLDLMLETGRRDWRVLSRHAHCFEIAGTQVTVASLADTVALRDRFKGDPR
jgi:hypothetical protein